MVQAKFLTRSRLEAYARSAGIVPSKRRGQNFVTDANTIRRLVRLAGLSPASRVLEIGPGLGSLTVGILAAGHSVVAVEVDSGLVRVLPEIIADSFEGAHPRFELIHLDALRLESLPDPPDFLVANLPYNLAAPILLRVFERFPIVGALVMVQAEVADRICAAPRSRACGGISLKLGWWGSWRPAGSVARSVFWPEPRVESKLITFSRQDHRDPRLRSAVFSLVDLAFAQRRKMLRHSLSSLSPKVLEILALADIDSRARPEMLGLEDFCRLTRVWRSHVS